MQIKRAITAASLVLMMGAAAIQAQNLRDNGTPAEFPPGSYTGKQYVDSNGCVFIRAGFDGAVTWVPRVSRKRTVLCGFAPTFAGPPAEASAPRVAAVAPPVTPPPRVAAPPVRTTAAAALPPRIVVAPAPVRTVVAPTYTPPTRVYAAPVPTNAPRRVVAAPTPTQTRRTCGASALSQRYLQTTSRFPVRCGPQAEAPNGYRNGATGISIDGIPSHAIRVSPPPKITPPPGYRSAWDDDRLNRNRGVQTAEGYAQSSLIWTNTVPRRLIDQRTGNVVTNIFPSLKFAFPVNRSMEQQIAYRQNIGERLVAMPPVTTGTTRYSTKAVPPARAVVQRTRVVAPPKPVAVNPGHAYVQVGMFSAQANAQDSAARLQRMGMPVRIGTYQKAGKSYRIVLAGPFNSTSALQAGLTAARRAGFPDAYTRN